MGLLDLFFGRKNNRQELHQEVAYLVVFSTSWCGPSKRFIKEIKEAGITNYTYIDAEEEEALAARFSIRSVPTTFLLDKNGTIIKKWVGYDDEDTGQSKFVQYIKEYPLPVIPYNKSVPGPFEKKVQPKDSKTSTAKVGDDKTHNSPSKERFVEDHRTHFYDLEDIKYRSMGEELMLAPYDANFYFNVPDETILPTLANSEKIRRFLPHLGFTNEEETKKRLKGYLIRTENQLGVAYFIRLKNIPIGMVTVDTPLYNRTAIGKAIWTIDFFIAEPFEHKGIVYNAVLRVLNEMKNAMGAKIVYALVDQNNHDCIKLIGNGFFNKVNIDGFVNNNGGLPPFVYMIDVEHTSFVKK